MNVPADRTPTPPQSSPEDKSYSLYVAAAAGAFIIGFGDILKNGSDTTHVTVLRIADVLRTYFSPTLGQGWIALLLLAILGAFLSWIRRPPTRTDSFAVGLSVFAVLTALAPSTAVVQPSTNAAEHPSTSLFTLLTSAYAQTDPSPNQTWPYYFHIIDPDNALHNASVRYSLYDQSESSLIQQPIETTDDTVLFNLPAGKYVLYVECLRCSRTRIDVTVLKKLQASNLILRGSSVPLGVQRLFRPGVTDTQDLTEAQAKEIAQAFAQRGR